MVTTALIKIASALIELEANTFSEFVKFLMEGMYHFDSTLTVISFAK